LFGYGSVAVKLLLLSSVLLLLSGCQSMSKPQTASDNQFSRLQQQLPLAAELPPYAELYQSYLQSPAVHQTGAAWQQLEQQLEQRPDACAKLPWQQQLADNFWTLSFYQTALSCLESAPSTENPGQSQDSAAFVQQLKGYQSYLLQGILASGNGKAAYSAYQINSYRDAHALVRQLGMQTIDYYAELSASDNALYYVIQVYDGTDDRFKALYFQNMPYLHAIDQVDYPFIGLMENWKKQLFADPDNPMLVLLHAVDAEQQQQYDTALQLYQRAIAADSLQARVGLAELCYQTKLPLPAKQCLDELTEAADRDYLPALQLLSFLHHSGEFGPPKAQKLTQLRQLINDRAGPGQAELQLSRYFFNKKFRQQDRAQGERWLKAAAATGQPEASAFWLLYQQEQQHLDNAATTAALQQLADQGNSVAAYLYVSQQFQQQTQLSQPQQLEKYLLQSSQNWHPEAFYLLGMAYLEGNFTSAEPGKAVQYLRLSASRFYPRAMLQLGNLYKTGEGLPKNLPLAHHWYLLCSKQGHPACAYQAGVMFDDGEGVSQNHQNAYRFYRFAASKDYTPAQNRLALLYLLGLGVEKNSTEAIKLLQKAAANGSVTANYYLGLLYFEGKEVPQDYPKAKQYFQLAEQHPAAKPYLKNWLQLTQPKPQP
jgi:TPR repeat protein